MVPHVNMRCKRIYPLNVDRMRIQCPTIYKDTHSHTLALTRTNRIVVQSGLRRGWSSVYLLVCGSQKIMFICVCVDAIHGAFRELAVPHSHKYTHTHTDIRGLAHTPYRYLFWNVCMLCTTRTHTHTSLSSLAWTYLSSLFSLVLYLVS